MNLNVDQIISLAAFAVAFVFFMVAWATKGNK